MVLLKANVCGRIRNFIEFNEKLSKHFKSSLLHAHQVLSVCVGSMTRLMTTSPFYPCGKPCSRGAHDETVQNPALSPAFDHDSIARISIERLPQLCSTVTPRKENAMKTTLSRRLR